MFKGCSFRMYVVWKYLCSGWCIFCIAINLVLFPASWHPGLTMAGISNICPEIIKCFTTQYRRLSKFTKYHRESVGLQEFFHHSDKSLKVRFKYINFLLNKSLTFILISFFEMKQDQSYFNPKPWRVKTALKSVQKY